METRTITSAADAPRHLQTGAKVAFAVGAAVRVSADNESLLVAFKDSDSYHFDPENITLHAFEALGAARTLGLVTRAPDGALLRCPLVVRVVYSNQDVRVQIGASKWFCDHHSNTAAAHRHALCNALAAYYDEAIDTAEA